VYVVSQVRRCLAGQRRVNETCQLEVDTSLDRKPVQLTQNWRDVVPRLVSVISRAFSTDWTCAVHSNFTSFNNKNSMYHRCNERL